MCKRLRRANTSSIYYTGSTWSNNNNELFVVMGQVDKRRGGGVSVLSCMFC